ncbi:unnamed protein product [Amoebophrya sp. A25]|nr:unnamed protein product [Amoebophrya sp. A25]|eukprot:GSA25T00017367001.1
MSFGGDCFTDEGGPVVDQLWAALSKRRGRVLLELNCRTRTANMNE